MDEKNLSLRQRITQFQESMIDVEILKTKEGYGYHYADLPSIMRIITPVLKECGIGYYHRTDFHEILGKNIVITVIYNVNEDENGPENIMSRTLIDDKAILAKMNRFMIEGSAITYFRRYHLTTMLGLLSDEDSDAGGKRPTAQKPGRSVESAGKAEEEIDYIEIFKNIIAVLERSGHAGCLSHFATAIFILAEFEPASIWQIYIPLRTTSPLRFRPSQVIS